MINLSKVTHLETEFLKAEMRNSLGRSGFELHVGKVFHERLAKAALDYMTWMGSFPTDARAEAVYGIPVILSPHCPWEHAVLIDRSRNVLQIFHWESTDEQR